MEKINFKYIGENRENELDVWVDKKVEDETENKIITSYFKADVWGKNHFFEKEFYPEYSIVKTKWGMVVQLFPIMGEEIKQFDFDDMCFIRNNFDMVFEKLIP